MLTASRYPETMTPAGASAYFSRPEHMLDPALFGTAGNLNPGIRDHILGSLYDFFRFEGIQAGSWLHAWLAGSGVSYQWKASRGNGDLDVLLGVDARQFTALNPGFDITGREQLAAIMNEQMKKYLWPLTAATSFGGTVYEVTYYWDHLVSDDITVIRPYAAWNLLTASWDITPDPAPRASFPPDWYAESGKDAARVQDLYKTWTHSLHDVLMLPETSPSRATAILAYKRATGELRAIWNLIHDGRRYAFLNGGEGWGDFRNFRWQAAKKNGTADLLHQVVTEDNRRRAAEDTRLYGAPVIPGELAYRRAVTASTRWLDR